MSLLFIVCRLNLRNVMKSGVIICKMASYMYEWICLYMYSVYIYMYRACFVLPNYTSSAPAVYKNSIDKHTDLKSNNTNSMFARREKEFKKKKRRRKEDEWKKIGIKKMEEDLFCLYIVKKSVRGPMVWEKER